MTLLTMDARVNEPVYHHTLHNTYAEFDSDFASLSQSEIDRLVHILSTPPSIVTFRQMHKMIGITVPFVRLMQHLYIRAHSVTDFPALYEPGAGYGREAVLQMYSDAVERLNTHSR